MRKSCLNLSFIENLIFRCFIERKWEVERNFWLILYNREFLFSSLLDFVMRF